MNGKVLRAAVVMGAALTIWNVATNATAVAIGKLPPVAARQISPGDISISKTAGEIFSSEVMRIEAGVVYSKTSTGCSRAEIAVGFGPEPGWKDCGGADGSQTLTRTGTIFPLEIGKLESWVFEGENSNGDTWAGTRDCVVKGIENVTVPFGNFNTYHVVCQEEHWVHEWYVNEEGLSVKFERTPRSGKDERYIVRELIDFTPAPDA